MPRLTLLAQNFNVPITNHREGDARVKADLLLLCLSSAAICPALIWVAPK